jgi:hypothetical protein
MPESSIEAAVAAAEQDGLRFLLRVRLVHQMPQAVHGMAQCGLSQAGPLPCPASRCRPA